MSILVPVFMYSGLYINLNLTVALSPARSISSFCPLEFFLLSIDISLAVCLNLTPNLKNFYFLRFGVKFFYLLLIIRTPNRFNRFNSFSYHT